VLLLIVPLSLCCYCSVVAKEFCHNEQFTADCPEGQVILMTSALYGRMRKGNCVRTDFGFVGCYADVIDHVHGRCSGRGSCSIRVPDATLDRTKPCNEDLKSYFDANFTCIEGGRGLSVCILIVGGAYYLSVCILNVGGAYQYVY